VGYSRQLVCPSVLCIPYILLGVVDTVFENIVGNTESTTVFINTPNYNTVYIQNTVFDKFDKFIFYKKKMLNFFLICDIFEMK
jgi:hypothetical protein